MKRITAWELMILLLIMLAGCMPQPEAAGNKPAEGAAAPLTENPSERASRPAVSERRDPLTGAVQEMNSADFWIALKEDSSDLRMTPEQCAAYNRAQRAAKETDLTDLDQLEETLSGAFVKEALGRYGAPSEGSFTTEGSLRPYVEEITNNIALDQVPERAELAFGFTVRSTEVRSYPSPRPVFSAPRQWEYDLAAETRAHMWTPFAVMHTSRDGQWLFVQTEDYAGWIPAEDGALCPKPQWEELRRRLEEDFLIVTGAYVVPCPRADLPETEGILLDMATRLPLEQTYETDNATGDNCYIVLLPLRCKDNSLDTVPIRIPMQEDVSVGYLPFTEETLIRQAFKLLGRRYGWGGTFGGWDCSSLCQDVYRTAGILLPRNSGAQARSVGFLEVGGQPLAAKKELLEQLPAGTMLVMKGHQTFFLGVWEGEGYVIHATHGVYATDGSGTFYNANSVVVTSVLAGRSGGRSILEQCHTVVAVKALP